MAFDRNVLAINVEETAHSISQAIRAIVGSTLRKRGAVVAVSGGIDSSVCAALCVRALGKEKVLALLLPEKDSSPDSTELATHLVKALGIASVTENISPILEAAGCYQKQIDAIRPLFPEYDDNWKSKISLPSILSNDRLNVSRLTVQSPAGEKKSERMSAQVYLQLVAATNFKQRIRKMVEYYHADKLNYAVCGTPNRLEYDQGFFVKGGDGLSDFKPIAHLYKTQVYQLAPYLGIPEEICRRPPTTDTFSLAQTQEEFYFALPYDLMDLCLYGFNHSIASEEVANKIGLTAEQVGRVYQDISTKRRTTLPLHLPPLLAGDVREIKDLISSAVEANGKG
jgi:NAD+ synthase